MAGSDVYYGSSSGLPVSFPVSESAKGAHTEVDGTQQSLRKELAVVNGQYDRVLWIKLCMYNNIVIATCAIIYTP